MKLDRDQEACLKDSIMVQMLVVDRHRRLEMSLYPPTGFQDSLALSASNSLSAFR